MLDATDYFTRASRAADHRKLKRGSERREGFIQGYQQALRSERIRNGTSLEERARRFFQRAP